MARPLLVTVLAVALGAAAIPSLAAEPVQVLIVGGGTPEEADAALARHRSAAEDLGKVATLADTFPMVRVSDEIDGLRPGFHVLLAGYCAKGDVEERLAVLRPFFPGTYARTVNVKLAAPACPALHASKREERSVAVGADQRLVVTRLEGDAVTLVRAALVRKDGAVLDGKTVYLATTLEEPPAAPVESGGECSDLSMSVRSGDVVLGSECGASFRAMCHYTATRSSWRVTARGDRIQVIEKHTGGDRYDCAE